jgi:hypothetical protein
VARTFGRILNSIWDDEDFLALSGGEQRMYVFLISQHNISWAGLLPMTLRRWSAKARDLTPDQILRDLKGLDRARFVVLDEDTEEVLVRSLVRRDEVYKMPRVLGSVVANAEGISSRKIRRALLAEIDRIPLAELSAESTQGRDGRHYPSVRSQVIEHIEALREAYGPMDADTQTEPLPEPLPEGDAEPDPEGLAGGSGERAGAQASPSPLPFPKQNPSASAAPSAGENDRNGDTQPPPPKPPRAKRPAIEHPELWETFWAAYPRKKDKGTAEKAWNKAIRDGIEPQTILDGVLFYRLDCAQLTDPKFIKYPATWLNARGWQDEPDPQPRAIGAPSEASTVQPKPWRQVQAELEARLNADD